MKKGITINLHIEKIVVADQSNSDNIAEQIAKRINRVLDSAFAVIEDNKPSSQRINPSKAVRIERCFSRLNKLGSMVSTIPISRLNDNSQLLHVIEAIHSILAEFEQNNDNLMRCECSSLQKELENSILDVAHGHSRTCPVNHGKIEFQIPKNQKVSSIQIQFGQDKQVNQKSRFSDSF